MRKDMPKVITERERSNAYGTPKGSAFKSYQKELEWALGPSVVGRSLSQLDCRDGHSWEDGYFDPPSRSFDALHSRESMKHRSGGTKNFTDVLGPLEGWVRKQIGRPGRKVLAEISAVLPATGGVSLTHARGHLFQFLLTECFYVDGVLCHSGYGGPMPVHGTYAGVAYIDPADDIVKPIKRDSDLRWLLRRRYPGVSYQKKPQPPTRRWVEGRLFVSVGEVWYEYTLSEAEYAVRVERREIPGYKSTAKGYTHFVTHHVYEGQFDVYLGATVEHRNESERTRIYRGNKYASARRQLNSREIKKLGLAKQPESQKPNLWRKKKPRGRRG